MNFIGHLHVARWHGNEPRLFLGAMLPDFAAMARVKLGEPSDSSVRAGIALHHRTDAAFHHQPAFIALMQETLLALTQRGVARGPARAVGHIGVEMLIDGELAQAHENGAAYLAALDCAHELDRDLALPSETRVTLALIHRRLRTHGVPYDYRNTEAVVVRLSRALAGRPRLAMSPEDARQVSAVLPALQRTVQGVLPELLVAVRAALLNEGVLTE